MDRAAPRRFEGRSVTGGLVYRGPDRRAAGHVHLRRLVEPSGMGTENRPRSQRRLGRCGARIAGRILSAAFNRLTAGGTPATEGVTSFGEDEAGNLYFVELGGELYKITGPIIGTAAGDYNHDGTRGRGRLRRVARLRLVKKCRSTRAPMGTAAAWSTMPITTCGGQNFGTSLPSGAASGNASQTPEPGCLRSLLAGSGVLYYGAARYARRRRTTSR